jgi:hypothetical protein
LSSGAAEHGSPRIPYRVCEPQSRRPRDLFAVLSAALERRFASYLSEWFASFVALLWS